MLKASATSPANLKVIDRQRYMNHFMWAVTAIGAAICLHAAVQLPFERLDMRFALLAAVTIGLSSRLSVKLPRVKGEVTVSDTFIFLTMLLYGGEAAVLLYSAEAYFSAKRFSKKRLTIYFNAAMMAASTFITVSIVQLFFGPIHELSHIDYSGEFIIAVCIMALAQYVSNAGIAAIRGSLKTNQTIWYTWSNGYLWTWVTYFAGASAAGITAKLVDSAGIYSFLIIGPFVAIVYFTYRTYLVSVEASQAQAELAERHVELLSEHVAEQERIRRALEESEEHFRNAFEHFRSAFDHAAGMALVSTDGAWLQVNGSLCDIVGYSEEELLATNFQSFTHPDDLRADLADVHQLIEGNISKSQMEKRYIHKLGHEVWVLTSKSVVRDKEGRPMHLIFQIQDITDRKRAEEQIRHAAFHDALTGLPNRTLLTERLSQAIQKAKRQKNYLFAVLFLDLDRFKIINDSIGHNAGDQLLIAIARRLTATIRKTDTVARLGGDEFAILLDNMSDSNNTIHIAGQLQESLSRPFALDEHEVFTTVSVGIAFSSTGYDSPEEILRDADIAMYRAKATGKARYEVFDHSMHDSAVSMLRMETDLRRAIERDEIRTQYQPILSLKTGQLIGFEALVRWQHPSRGLIAPADFIPVAEESGLIVPLGLVVLREACEQLSMWRGQFSESSHITMSVNLSARQFAQAGLVEQIAAILKETGLDPGSLILEITESVLMENAEATAVTLNQLRRLGAQLSIDDFGTGYSSLSYLHRFPVNTLKIDRSFVTRMGLDDESAEIVRTIITLARNLKIEAIAEGVETEQHVVQLKRLGCQYGQGYLFSKPLTARQAEALLLDRWQWQTAISLAVEDGTLQEATDHIN